MADRITRVLQELIAEGAPAARVTRAIQELLAEGAPAARITRVLQELLAEGAPAARVTRLFQEIFADNPVVIISPFLASFPEEDEDASYPYDDFAYDDESSAMIFLSSHFIFSAAEEDPDFPERFDFDAENRSADALRRRFIRAHLWVAT